ASAAAWALPSASSAKRDRDSSALHGMTGAATAAPGEASSPGEAPKKETVKKTQEKPGTARPGSEN
ncbi:hypothetical protein, partial [Escherichia coli]|uniref:hypothetical protein n=1 Tax=Escherichia coli TaxID=562 RepID=UPI00195395F0